MTALVRDGEESLALSSTARSPVRVTVEVPRAELEPLAQLLDEAQRLIEESARASASCRTRSPTRCSERGE